MTINRFRGDAIAAQKIIRLIGPGGSGIVQAEITCGNRLYTFAQWNPATIATALNNSGAPEFADVLFAPLGQDVIATGPLDDDFIIGLSYRPTITITNDFGITQANQITSIGFNGARAGTYKLTINGKQTGTITYGDQADLIAEIELLSGWTAGNAIVRSATSDEVLIEFKGSLAGTPVAVTMDASDLHNGRLLTVREKLPHSPEPHDIWLLGMEASNECTITIDGNAAIIRTDFGLEKTRDLIKSLADNRVEVYGGYIAPTGRIATAHYVLDFVGYGVSTRPTVTVSAVGSPPSAAICLYDPTAGLIAYDVASDASSNRGYARLMMLDFTQGSKISLSYDGQEFEVTNSNTTGLAAASTVNAHSIAVNAVLTTMRDLSEFFEADNIITGTIGSGWGWMEAPRPALNSTFHPLIYYIIDDNGTLEQTGGTGTLRLLHAGGSVAQAAVHEVFVPPGTTGGSFNLTFPEGTTASIASAASAATIEGLLDTLIAAGMGVAGTGIASNPWTITYTAALKSRPLPIASDVALSGNGIGSVSNYQNFVRPKTQSATISISGNAISGTYRVLLGNDGPVTLTLGDSAATVDTALGTLQAIAGAGNITTTYDAASSSYLIVFAGSLVNQLLPAFRVPTGGNNLDVIATTTISLQQRATGPRNFAESQNWTLGRIPHAGDVIVLEVASADIRYGLRQWVQVTANTSSEILTAAAGHDLREGQVIRFLTTGTLPTGISAATDYYVLDSSTENGTFRISATASGGPVNITGAGSGVIFCGVLAAQSRIAASFSNQIGRPERTDAGNAEYLPRYLQVGLPSGGVCDIGSGIGRASALIRIDVGNSQGSLNLIRSDSSSETDRPAVSILANSSTFAVSVSGGDLGIAAHDGESSVVGAIMQAAGTIYCGEVTAGSLTKNSGRILSRLLSVSGDVVIKG